jgi:hypothetical protein
MFFMPTRTQPTGERSGECRLGCWPAPLADTSTCASHRVLGSPPKPATKSPRAPRGQHGVRADVADAPSRPVLPQEIDIAMDQAEFRNVLREILREELGVADIELGDRWLGGEVVLVPGKAGTQEKRIPIDSLFRKVVLIREKLRVLEQKLNNHERLSDEDRVQLQQYVTQCYGSLTTFNVLFKHKQDQFSGQAKDD